MTLQDALAMLIIMIVGMALGLSGLYLLNKYYE